MFDIDTFGKLKDISRFDAPFFNFSDEEAHQSAPDVRIMLEVIHHSDHLLTYMHPTNHPAILLEWVVSSCIIIGMDCIILHRYWNGLYHPAPLLKWVVSSCTIIGMGCIILHHYWNGLYHPPSLLEWVVSFCIIIGMGCIILHHY